MHTQGLSTHRQNKKRNLSLLRYTICTKRDETLIQSIRQFMYPILEIVLVRSSRNTAFILSYCGALLGDSESGVSS